MGVQEYIETDNVGDTKLGRVRRENNLQPGTRKQIGDPRTLCSQSQGAWTPMVKKTQSLLIAAGAKEYP